MTTQLPRTTQLIEQGRERGLHIGAQVCVAVGSDVVADLAIGHARDAHVLRTDHRMLWLSAGKPLLAIAVAQLWEQKLLSPDDFVAAHIPGFAAHGKSVIRIQHLLTHTHAYQPPAIDWPRLPWDTIIAQICNARIPESRAPGNYAAYDPQTTWYLLAEIVQLIAGQSFYSYIEQKVLRPMGCATASIGLPPGEYTRLLDNDQLAPLHDTTQTARESKNLSGGGAPIWAAENEARAVAHNPGGGALGTARDLCRFYQVLGEIHRGESTAGILRSETLHQMTRRVREGLLDHAFKQRIDWGLGFLINSRRYGGNATPYGYGSRAGEETFGHGGVQSTSAWYDPQHQVAAAIIYNGLPGEAKHNKRIHDINSMLYEELLGNG